MYSQLIAYITEIIHSFVICAVLYCDVLCVDDIGKGLGPAIVVAFIQAFGHNRQAAFSMVTCMWILCGLLLLSLSFFVEKDEKTVQEQVKRCFLKTQKIKSDEEEEDESIQLTTDFT